MPSLPPSIRPGRRHIGRFLLGLGLALPLAAAAASPLNLLGETVKGNGVIRKQVRELGRFTGVALGVPGQVEVRIGPTESVSIETDENLLPLIETVIEGGTLEIRTPRRNTSLETRTLRIVVQARQVERLAVGGAGSISAETLRAPRLQFDIGGSGAISVKDAASESVAVSIGGSGNLKAGGATRKLTVAIGGSGDVQAGQLKAEQVSVNIAGSGQAVVWARESLTAAIAGSGDVSYYGDPRVTQTTVGSGRTKRLGAAP